MIAVQVTFRATRAKGSIRHAKTTHSLATVVHEILLGLGDTLNPTPIETEHISHRVSKKRPTFPAHFLSVETKVHSALPCVCACVRKPNTPFF